MTEAKKSLSKFSKIAKDFYEVFEKQMQKQFITDFISIDCIAPDDTELQNFLKKHNFSRKSNGNVGNMVYTYYVSDCKKFMNTIIVQKKDEIYQFSYSCVER